MSKNNLPIKLLLLGLFILIFGCKDEILKPIPRKHPKLSQGKYDKHLKLLKEAYATNDNFDAAIQLANLKADKSKTYQLLNLSIKEQPTNCDKIYEWYWLYDRHNFGVNILKLDTIRFKEAIAVCEGIGQNYSYQDYAKRKDEEEELASENQQVEDSTNFNRKLVAELQQIQQDDQSIRKRASAKNISLDMEEKLRREMQQVDSINLDKIDKIFKKYGYPSSALVGRKANFVPALVIHHSKSLETRYKYLPFLEKAVADGLLSEGTLDMIRRRIEDMELDQK